VLARRGVDHRPAADRVGRRDLAQDQPVARRRHERCLEPQLREPLPAGHQLVALERHDPRRRVARPVVDLHASAAPQGPRPRLEPSRHV
jgi:hypothetical protein